MTRPEQGGNPALRLVLWGVAIALFVAVAWRSPASPLGVQRGDVLWHRGRLTEAAAQYDAVAAQNPLASVRRAALERCASLWRTALKDPGRVRLCLQALAQDEDADAGQRAGAWARLADLLGRELQQPGEAAGAWRLAYEADPEAEAAAERLAASARALTVAGEAEAAHEVWDKLAKRFDAWEARARLAQGDLLLGKGRLRPAVEAYRQAIDSGPDKLTLNLAQAGKKACERRLEHVESALRTMANDDIPDSLRKALLQGPAEDEAAPPTP